jgi:hypothetical protein
MKGFGRIMSAHLHPFSPLLPITSAARRPFVQEL